VINMAEASKIIPYLDQLLEDTSVPKNVRLSIQKAKDKILEEQNDLGVSGAIYALDEVSNDINLPTHARTIIWNILSELEGMKS